MRFLIIQERGRHKKNEEFRECLNLQRALIRQGAECIVWGLNFDNFGIPFEKIQESCDVILLLENYESGKWLPDMSQSKKLKIFWSIDSHWNLRPHIDTCNAQKIDILLNSTFGYLDHFRKPGRRCYWFPNAYPEDLIKPIEGIKKEGVGFCGNVVNRMSWIQYLKEEVGMRFDNFVIGQDMVRAINGYAISWNRNIKDDVNYRTSESLGCRTFLLTNETDRLKDLFQIEKHLVTYDTPMDCADKARYFLKNDSEREEIQNAGYEHVRNNHTYDHRTQLLIDIVEGNVPED